MQKDGKKDDMIRQKDKLYQIDKTAKKKKTKYNRKQP